MFAKSISLSNRNLNSNTEKNCHQLLVQIFQEKYKNPYKLIDNKKISQILKSQKQIKEQNKKIFYNKLTTLVNTFDKNKQDIKSFQLQKEKQDQKEQSQINQINKKVTHLIKDNRKNQTKNNSQESSIKEVSSPFQVHQSTNIFYQNKSSQKLTKLKSSGFSEKHEFLNLNQTRNSGISALIKFDNPSDQYQNQKQFQVSRKIGEFLKEDDQFWSKHQQQQRISQELIEKIKQPKEFQTDQYILKNIKNFGVPKEKFAQEPKYRFWEEEDHWLALEKYKWYLQRKQQENDRKVKEKFQNELDLKRKESIQKKSLSKTQEQREIEQYFGFVLEQCEQQKDIEKLR